MLMERLRLFARQKQFTKSISPRSTVHQHCLLCKLLVDIRSDHASAESHTNELASITIDKRMQTSSISRRKVTKFIALIRFWALSEEITIKGSTRTGTESTTAEKRPILVELGRVHTAIGNMTTEHIVQYFESALKIEPGFPDAMLELAMILPFINRSERSEASFRAFWGCTHERSRTAPLFMARYMTKLVPESDWAIQPSNWAIDGEGPKQGQTQYQARLSLAVYWI